MRKRLHKSFDFPLYFLYPLFKQEKALYYLMKDVIVLVTIRDIANAANVSPSTVSRVLSGNRRISITTRERVKQIMADLNYQPNHAARTLITKKSKTIGIIQKQGDKVTRQNPFIIEVLSGIYTECKRHDYATISTTGEQINEILTEVQQMIQSHAVEGFILLYSKENDAIANLLKQQSVPYVVIGKPINHEKIVHIDNDNILAAQLLTRYLITLGHTSFQFLAELGDYEVVKDRITGYKRALKEAYLKPNTVFIEMNRQQIISHFKTLINENTLPTIVITSDTMLNQLVLSALYELKIAIPEEIQTATFNDSYISANAAPPQTAVDIQPQLLGRAAGESIMALVSGNHIDDLNIIIPTHIVNRRSTQKL